MEIARLHLDINLDFDEQYKCILDDDKTYSTSQYKEAYTNYRNHCRNMRNTTSGGNDNDLLQMLTVGMLDSGLTAMRQTLFSKTLEKAVKSSVMDMLRKELKGVATVTD